MQTYRTYLSEKKQLAFNVYLFRFNLKEPATINFMAGQYLILKINNLPRLYSIASPPFIKDSFELLVEIVAGGLASTYLANLKIGDEQLFQGPAGVFVLKENQSDNNRRQIFLATGTGIAPIRSMILTQTLITNHQSPITSHQPAATTTNHQPPITNAGKSYLFWGLRNYQDVYLFEEFKGLNTKIAGRFEFIICLSREQNLDMVKEEEKKHFVLGRINIGLDRLFEMEKSINNSDFYLCGAREAVEFLKQYLFNKGVNRENIFFEKF